VHILAASDSHPRSPHLVNEQFEGVHIFAYCSPAAMKNVLSSKFDNVSLSRCTLIALTLVLIAVGVSLWTGLIVLRIEVQVNPDNNMPFAPQRVTAGDGDGSDGAPAAGQLAEPPVKAPAAQEGSDELPPTSRVHTSSRKNLPPRPPSSANAANPKCNAGDRARWRPGKCAFDNLWLEPWTRHRPHGNWTLVDVGANKGYVIAGWLDVLQQRSQFSPHHLGMYLFNRTMTNLESGWLPSHCGGCCECLDRPPAMPPANKAHSVKVYGFEPGVANYKWLSSFFTDRNLVTIRNAAAGEKSSRVYFPDVPLGVEIGKVSETPKKGFVPVDIITLDEELEHVEFLDVLSTDAEGFDQAVARGARKFLEQGRVGVYQFEMYAPDNYRALFEKLKTWGYDCYFSTASRRDKSHPPKKPFFRVPTLVRITDCWEDEYQGYIGWVNGLCHNTRIETLNKIFSYLAHKSHKGGSGNCDGKTHQRRKVRKFIEDYVVPLKAGEAKTKERPDEPAPTQDEKDGGN
jgi:FkbM family methyltransferase